MDAIAVPSTLTSLKISADASDSKRASIPPLTLAGDVIISYLGKYVSLISGHTSAGAVGISSAWIPYPVTMMSQLSTLNSPTSATFTLEKRFSVTFVGVPGVTLVIASSAAYPYTYVIVSAVSPVSTSTQPSLTPGSPFLSSSSKSGFPSCFGISTFINVYASFFPMFVIIGSFAIT